MRSIRFLLFEIKRVLFYDSTIFKLTNLFILYLFIKSVYADKKLFKKNKKHINITDQEFKNIPEIYRNLFRHCRPIPQIKLNLNLKQQLKKESKAIVQLLNVNQKQKINTERA